MAKTEDAATAASDGRAAFARLVEGFGRQAAEADALWPDFVEAVAAANAEIAEREAEGLRRWQNLRHPEADG